MTTFSRNSVFEAGLQHIRDNPARFEVSVELLIYHLLNAAERYNKASSNYFLLVKVIREAFDPGDPRCDAALAFIATLHQAKGEDDEDDLL